MLTKLEQAKLNFGGRHQAIDSWLTERQNILVNYCQLAGLPPYEDNHNALPETGEISQFCQLLVDYVSAGHFEVYDQLMEKSVDAAEGTSQIPEQIYAKIAQTTDAALEFNDRYAEVDGKADDDNDVMLELDQDLSALGKALEIRFELEDQLLSNMHQQNPQPA